MMSTAREAMGGRSSERTSLGGFNHNSKTSTCLSDLSCLLLVSRHYAWFLLSLLTLPLLLLLPLLFLFLLLLLLLLLSLLLLLLLLLWLLLLLSLSLLLLLL